MFMSGLSGGRREMAEFFEGFALHPDFHANVVPKTRPPRKFLLIGAGNSFSPGYRHVGGPSHTSLTIGAPEVGGANHSTH